MQPLVTEFEDRTFRYAQLERHGNVAIFTQTHKLGGGVRYEVVRIRIAPEHTWPNGTTSPEREVYPGSSSWGQLAWTTHHLKEARAVLQALCTEQDERDSAAEGGQDRRAEDYGPA